MHDTIHVIHDIFLCDILVIGPLDTDSTNRTQHLNLFLHSARGLGKINVMWIPRMMRQESDVLAPAAPPVVAKGGAA